MPLDELQRHVRMRQAPEMVAELQGHTRAEGNVSGLRMRFNLQDACGEAYASAPLSLPRCR
jgi:hypothetical protein